ncbi:uncharacterized protein LACBIDRAFT_309287 [Laccaria bicolor S238N-H82]|uniref:Predicted protein n=1 Tax=Laccaria bicolor (strain S238N-H82 / ATCC MYA-4686) TaxID=486041 RepID=B0CW10_LACBS|nr:uncharacterized protein LACBIDRAFT_309287 [Laccaria bicolor S238N-H82]EDR13834.1 predicted protein [Laccaria bicolor S238N-H82]|eukprot:XP_001876332.1 predicted protein [Laccaria bicolor S238N-H82]
MNSTYPIPPSRHILPHIGTTCSNPRCTTPLEFPVPSPYLHPGTLLQIRCFQCQMIVSPGLDGTGEQQQQQQRKGRKIGTQERPLTTSVLDSHQGRPPFDWGRCTRSRQRRRFRYAVQGWT